jgi:O-antigen/teichoic acid export membrane protein
VKLFDSYLFKASGVFFVSNAIAAGTPFVILLWLTRYVSPEEMGIFSLFAVAVNLLIPFLGLCTAETIYARYFDKEFIFGTYLLHCFYVLAFFSLIAAVLFWLFQPEIARISYLPLPWVGAILLAAIGKVIVTVLSVLFTIAREPYRYAFLQVGQAVFYVIASLVLVFYLQMSWQGLILVQVVVNSCFALFGLYIIAKRCSLSGSFQARYVWDIVRTGSSFLPIIVSTFAIASLDRLIVSELAGLAATGIYALSYQAASAFSLITASFNKAWWPWFVEKLNDGAAGSRIQVVKCTYAYLLLLSAGGLICSFLLKWLVREYAGSEYYQAVEFIPWFIASGVFYGMYGVVSDYTVLSNRTHWLAGIKVAAVVLYAPLAYCLVSNSGAIGAAQALAIINLLLFMVTWRVGAYLQKMPWSFFAE